MANWNDPLVPGSSKRFRVYVWMPRERAVHGTLGTRHGRQNAFLLTPSRLKVEPCSKEWGKVDGECRVLLREEHVCAACVFPLEPCFVKTVAFPNARVEVEARAILLKLTLRSHAMEEPSFNERVLARSEKNLRTVDEALKESQPYPDPQTRQRPPPPRRISDLYP